MSFEEFVESISGEDYEIIAIDRKEETLIYLSHNNNCYFIYSQEFGDEIYIPSRLLSQLVKEINDKAISVYFGGED